MASPFASSAGAGAEDRSAADLPRGRARAQAASAADPDWADPDWAADLDWDASDGGAADSDVRQSGGSAETTDRPRKKVGRPIKHTANVDSEELTESERRRIKRRVANRESARRVRQKRQETMDEMKSRLDVLTQQLHALTAHVQGVEGQKASLLKQLTEMRERWNLVVQQNARLRGNNDGTSAPDGSDGPLEPCSSSGPDCSTAHLDVRVPSVNSAVSPMGAADSPTPPSTLKYTAGGFQFPFAPCSAGYGGVYGGSTAITSGQPKSGPDGVVPATASISCLRPRVVITTAGGGFGGSPGSQPDSSHGLKASSFQVTASAPAAALPAVEADIRVTGEELPAAPDVKADAAEADPLSWLLNQPSLGLTMMRSGDFAQGFGS